MTTQEAYERIREYFSRPGAELGKSDHGSCAYITASGAKCAVGCLIPDEILSKWGNSLNESGSLEGLKDGVVDNYGHFFMAFRDIPGLQELLNGEDAEGQRKFDFLSEAQKRHDDSFTKTAEQFVAKLDVLAGEFGLRT